jgi:poly-gamma-glutamate synthesis protein (capsule biosynthesis protein)
LSVKHFAIVAALLLFTGCASAPRETASAEAGADLVVGDHPHVLQGVELVKNVPVFYSLGNYWFNRREEYTMLLKAELSGDKYGLRQVRWRVIPAWQSNAKVKALTEEGEQQAMYDYLEALPGSNIRINQKGYIKKR